MTATPAGAPRTTGYRIMLSPGWAQVPLRSGTEEAIAAILDAVTAERVAVAELTDDQDELAAIVRDRERLTEQLRKDAKTARNNRGVHLYLPITAIHGQIAPASFVVAEFSFGSVDPLDPNLFVGRMAADPGAKRVQIDGVAASRTESAHPADPRRNIPWPSRRIDYLLPFPGDADRWLGITFSVLQPTEQDDHASAWIKLFDAMMTTFRWTHTP